MDTVELIWKIEECFKIKIANRDAEQIFTVKDIHETVFRYLQPLPDSAKAEIQITIDRIIADHAGLDLADVTPDKSITMDLGLD